MRNPGGYLLICEPLHKDKEADTFTCGHCNSIKIVKVKTKAEDLGGLCKVCMKLICSNCVDYGTCSPFEKALEASEKRQEVLRNYARH